MVHIAAQETWSCDGTDTELRMEYASRNWLRYQQLQTTTTTKSIYIVRVLVES